MREGDHQVPLSLEFLPRASPFFVRAGVAASNAGPLFFVVSHNNSHHRLANAGDSQIMRSHLTLSSEQVGKAAGITQAVVPFRGDVVW